MINKLITIIVHILLMGSSKNLMSFRCAVDLVGRLYNKSAGTLAYFKELLCNMTAEDAVQISGRRFLEVPFSSSCCVAAFSSKF